MMRLCSLAFVVTCCCGTPAVAKVPFARFAVVVSDDATASLLPPLPKGTQRSVLLRKERESEQVIHSRAIKLRYATHFVYRSGRETPMSAKSKGTMAARLSANAEHSKSFYRKRIKICTF